MKMKCGQHVVTINPYVWTKRRNSYAEVCGSWDDRVDKLASKIDCAYLMAKNEGIEELPWSLEDMFALIKLSSEARERATMVRGFIQDDLHMRPAFQRPEPRDRWAVRVYNKYVTSAEKRLFLVRCGIEEYYYTLPDGMLQ